MDYQKCLLFYGLSKMSVTRDCRDTFVTRDYLDRSVSNAGQILGIIATEPLPASIRTDLSLQVCSHDRSVTKDDRDNSVMVNALPVYYAFVHGPIRGSIGTCQSLIIGPALRIVKSEFELQFEFVLEETSYQESIDTNLRKRTSISN